MYAVDPNLQLPVTYQWNIAIERALGANQRVSATYVGAHGHRLIREDSIVKFPNGSPTIFATQNGDWSNYSALQMQFQRRMAHGLQALASYTPAKSTDTNSTETCLCTPIDRLGQIKPAAELGPSDFDVRNSFAAPVSYQPPAPPGHLSQAGNRETSRGTSSVHIQSIRPILHSADAFPLSERASLYARAEYFNVFNHPMFSYPNNFLGLPFSNTTFGIVTTTLNTILGGLNPLYQVGAPRSAQFTLKLMF
ncbi:MAG: hypothetical protein JO033_03100 [Acidobacteriaceae bacterium]|nr:hypothetical protein [Acidobacteriota bacterium]MBV8807638.1 hypothetical protein [Acidobacteriaceae bacterium]MBV9502392.1 hypothetical protein [Acidobacteriaceae bacterium]